MEETIGKASLRDAAIGTGVAVDKMLALTGQTPVGIQIANIAMPTVEEREARRQTDRKLDEIARRLAVIRVRIQTGSSHALFRLVRQIEGCDATTKILAV